jgi:hypothetical protein
MLNRAVASAGIALAISLAGAMGFAQGLLRGPGVVQLSGSTYHTATCPGPVGHGMMRCFAHIVTDRAGNPLVNRFVPNRFERLAKAAVVPAGYGPMSLISAYHPAVLGSYPAGVGSPSTVVALVDAYGYPNAEADLAVYRSTFGLPPCTTANGCFGKYNQNGLPGAYPPVNLGWEQETALDLDMASAMCPHCKIILVEANGSSTDQLGAAENTAVALGANVISNSWGGDETGAGTANHYFQHPGVAITASTGDEGFAIGPQFPATSPNVTAVGGTSLLRAPSAARGWTESAWIDGGSGCSVVFAKPAWQASIPLCAMRMEADISAVANPDTGVAVYGPVNANKSSWTIVGGTSAAAPLVAGLYGAHGPPYVLGSPYRHTDDFNDVQTGHNGTCARILFCTAGVGYDGPTGIGTPKGVAPF